MKITVENREKKYVAVNCGPKCSFRYKEIDKDGEVSYCTRGCKVPKFWRMVKINTSTLDDSLAGLRKIG